MRGFFFSKLKKIKDLSPAERRFCLNAVFRLIRLKFALRFFPYQKVLEKSFRCADRHGVSQTVGEFSDDISPEDIGSLLEKCARNLPLKLRCLPIALAGYVLFRRLGVEVNLRIGAKQTQNDGFSAHAWLELEDRVLVGDLPDLSSYARFNSREDFPG